MTPPALHAASEFLEVLLAGVPADSTAQAYVWRLQDKSSSSFPAIDPDAMRSVTSWEQPPADLYVGASLAQAALSRHQRVTKATAAGIMGVWADVDVLGPAHGKPNLPPTDEDAFELLRELGAPPSILVHSGHGLQAWWLLPRAWMFQREGDVEDAERLTTQWVSTLREVAQQRDWDVDSVGDIARVLRLPGTVNAKVAHQRVSVQLLYSDGPRYEVEELWSRIAHHVRGQATTGTGQCTASEGPLLLDEKANPPAEHLGELLAYPPAMASWNHDRPDLQDQSPSSYDLSLAAIAARRAWDDQDIVDLLIASRRHNGKPPKLRQDYYRRTLERARASISNAAPSTDDDDDEEPKNPWLARIKADGLVPTLADDLEDRHFFAQDEGGQIHIWRGGVYDDATRFLRSHVRSQLEEWEVTKAWKRDAVKELTEYLRARAPQLWLSPGTDRLNLRNGLVDLTTGQLLPHSPAHLSTVQLPVEFDPDARCPAWDRFVSETFPEDAQHVAFEIVAFAMVPDASIQKALLLVGEGGNGKSVFLRGLQAFLGRQNFSTLPLQRIEAERFSSSRLVGRLANICADLPAADLQGSSTFKGITGGDTITGERKYHDSFDFRPYCRLIFSANTPPRTPDASEAFFDRWIVVPFERTFRGQPCEIPGPVLDERLAAPAELSGVLNRALAALPAVRDRGISEPLSLVAAK